MRIHELVWTQDNIDHIARHGVSPSEVEEVCRREPWVVRTQSTGRNPVYHVRGRTEAGRHLFCIVIRFPDGKWYPVMARPMTEREKKRYRQHRRQRPQ